MKNIHILPTDKPSKLISNVLGLGLVDGTFTKSDLELIQARYQNIYITSDEEIKDGDKDFYIIANDRDKTWINRLEKVIECRIDPKHGKVLILSSGFIWLDEGEKIILTTDQDLIKDGVQAIDDKFLEWFVKNPSCEKVEVKDSSIVKEHIWDGSNDGEIIWEKEIIIPKEEPKQKYESECICDTECRGFTNVKCKKPKQETLEEFISKSNTPEGLDQFSYDKGLEDGAKWQKEQDKKKYSEEDMREAFKDGSLVASWSDMGISMKYDTFEDWFEQHKKK